MPAVEKVSDRTWEKEKSGLQKLSRQFHKGLSVTSWWHPVRLQSILCIHNTLRDSLCFSDHMDLGWGGQGHPKLLSLIATIMPSSLQGAFMENGATAPQDWCHCTLDYKRAREICPATHSEHKWAHNPVILSWMWHRKIFYRSKVSCMFKSTFGWLKIESFNKSVKTVYKTCMNYSFTNHTEWFIHELNWTINLGWMRMLKKYICCSFYFPE